MRQIARIAVPLFIVAAALTAATPSGADSAPAPDSALPGSTCVPSTGGLSYTAPGSGISTTALGVGAPAYYELGAPSGDFAGQRPKAIMLVIHGGGWYTVGKGVVAATRAVADRWRTAGWETLNLDYRGCADSIKDVFWFMNRIRLLNPLAVVCVQGKSAGGHLALILASIRRDLACAISDAGPSDLVALSSQQATDRVTGQMSSSGPTQLSNLAVAAFGAKPSPLVNSSPMRYAGWVTARLLLATGAGDVLVPPVQDTNYAAAVLAGHPSNYVDVVSLPKGNDVLFVHSLTTQAGLDALRVHEDALVKPLVG